MATSAAAAKPNLFEPVSQGSVEGTIYALVNGADKDAKNSDGKTALELAPDNNIAYIVQAWPTKPYDVPDAIQRAADRQKDFQNQIANTESECKRFVADKEAALEAKLADLKRQMALATKETEEAIAAAQSMRDMNVQSLSKTVDSLRQMNVSLEQLDSKFVNLAVSDFRRLDDTQVIALMRRMKIQIDESKLKGITGEILAEINEGDIEPYFGIKKVGPRRRLMAIIRKLKLHASFDQLYVPSCVEAKPGEPLPEIPYTWNNSHVLEFLRQENLTELAEVFRNEDVTGDVLMDLSGNDMREMGVMQLGPRVMCEKRIVELRKPFAEPADSNPLPPEQIQQILRQHVEYETKLQEMIERLAIRLAGDTRPIPADFLCPISRQLMEDPVIGQDSHTYERICIEAWLIEHQTSPMTCQYMGKNLIPNTNLRRMIAQFIDDRPAA